METLGCMFTHNRIIKEDRGEHHCSPLFLTLFASHHCTNIGMSVNLDVYLLIE